MGTGFDRLGGSRADGFFRSLEALVGADDLGVICVGSFPMSRGSENVCLGVDELCADRT